MINHGKTNSNILKEVHLCWELSCLVSEAVTPMAKAE